jgi:lysophospholipid acyltransferase (LPLAT)-like uncharacterized protein
MIAGTMISGLRDMLKRLLRHPAVMSAATWLVAGYLRFALATTRWQLVGAPHYALLERGEPIIVAFWHEHLATMPALWQRALATTPKLRMFSLVSRHQDGRLIGDVLARFGMTPAYGSTARPGKERGGVVGALSLLDALQERFQVGISPDGPRGPRRVAAKGVARLAALSGCPILPCSVRSHPCGIMPSWDRMILPLPFARGALVCGEPIHVPRDGAAAALPVITEALNAVADEAERLCR